MEVRESSDIQKVGFDFSIFEVATFFLGAAVRIHVLLAIWVKPTRSYELWDAIFTTLYVFFPLFLGFAGITEVKKFEVRGEVSASAAKQIRSTLYFLVFVTYMAISALSDLAFHR